MKKTKFSLLVGILAIGLSGIFFACEPEVVVEAPLVTVNPAEEVIAAPGDTVTYELIVSSNTDLHSVFVEVSADDVVIATADTVFAANVQAAIINFPIIVSPDFADGSTISVSFTADNQGKSTEVIRSIAVVKPAGEINTYTAIILADIENPNGSSFFSLDNNLLLTLNEARSNSDKVDLIYYYGATNKATLCNATDEGVKAFTDSHNNSIVDQLTTKNNTELSAVTMTAEEFTAVMDDDPITSIVPEAVATAVNQLAIGNVIYAKTVTGKLALIMVKDIIGAQGTSEITIEVKIQK